MNKQRKTSHILNVFQYDADGHVVLPASLTLGIAPGAEDNNSKVPTTAWVRGLVSTTGSSLVPTSRSITINGTSYDLSSNRSWSIDTGVLTASAGSGISVSVVNQNLNIVNTGLLTGTAGAGISVSTVNQNLNIVNTGLLTGTAGAGISVSTVNQNLNIVNTGLLTASSGLGISVSTVGQNLNIVNTGILTASAGSGISVSVVGQNLNIVNSGILTATAGAGISLSVVDGNLNIVNTITDNNQLANGAGYATTSYVTTQINNLVAGAPGLLDTLDELAAALGDDANFATTTATSLGNRLRVDTAAQGLTSTQQGNARTNLGLGTAALSATGDFATAAQGTKADTAHGWGNHASAGYLTTSSAASTYASLTGSYANPSWITSLAYSKITGVPAFLTSYTEVDTLASVTGRGASTSTAVTFSGGASISNLLVNGAPSIAESSLALGAMGATEGGQLTLNRATSHTFAAHLDVWQDVFRVLYGTNTATTGIALSVNLSTRQLILPQYTTSSTFTGTAAGVLAFDSSGNIITIAVPGGAVSSVSGGTGVSVNSTTGAVTVSIGQSVATSAAPTFDQVITTNNGNGTNFRIGDDVWIGDINAANTFRVQGLQDATQGYIVFGNSNATALGRSGTGALTYGGNTIYHAGNLTNLNQLTNGPGYITSYSETDTLASVTARGASTSTALTISGVIISTSGSYGYVRPAASNGSLLLGDDSGLATRGIVVNNNGGAVISTAASGQVILDTQISGTSVLRVNGNQTVTILGNTVWHQGNLTNLNQLSNGPGYITGYTETDTLATVTARGASTTSFVSMTGGSRIVVQNSTDGGNNRGIFMWNTSDPNWGIYMAQSGAGRALNDGTASTGLDGRTEHAIRFRVAASTSQPGFIWENSNNTALMQLQPNTGDLYIIGRYISQLNTASGRSNLSFNTSSSLLGNIHIQNGAGPTSGSANQAAITFMGSSSSQSQAGIYVLNDNSNGTSMGFAVTESYAAGPQLFMTATNNGIVNFPRATPTVAGNGIWHAGNFTPGSYLPLSGGVMTGALVNNIDGAVIIESNASENNNWLWKENAKQWGLFWFNRGSQSGQTIGSYSTIGAELMFMGAGSGVDMPTGWTGYTAGSKIAAMISNWNGYIYSASTIFAASDMRAPIFYDSADTSFYLDLNSYSRLSRVGVGGAANDVSGININGDAGLTGANFFYFGHSNGLLGSWQTRTFASGGRQIWNTNGFEVNRDGYGGGLIIYSDSSARVGFATSDFSYTASDNTAVVSGGISNNRVFVNGSIQLLNNADAIVIGRGTSTFLKDEELGFGWGGGWYMVDGTWLRVRNDKNIITGGTIRSDSDMRAPIYYDQNDTTYYGDFNGTSRFYQAIVFGDSSRYSAVSTTINGTGAGDKLILYGNASNYDARVLVGTDYDFIFKSQGSPSNKGMFRFYSGNNATLALEIRADQNVYAPATIYSAAYRGNANVGGTGEATWHPAGIYSGGTQWLYGDTYRNNSATYNLSYLLMSGGNTQPINITGSSHKYLTINPGNGYEAMVRYIGGSGSGWYVGKRTASQQVGTDSFHFYSEAAGATVVGINTSGDVVASGAVYASNWFRTYGNSGWYSQTYGGGWFMEDSTWIRSYGNKPVYVENFVRAQGSFRVGSEYSIWAPFGTYSSYMTRIAYMSFDWDASYNTYSNHGIASTDRYGNFTDDVSINSYSDINLRIDSNGNDGSEYVRFHHHSTGDNQFAYIGYSGSAFEAYFTGTVYATGDVIAYYSDARLKKEIIKIDSALDKLSKINGYYYKPNEIALSQKNGEKDERKIGVLAQEMQQVFPEVVSYAPFDRDEFGKSKSGKDYLTVKYDRLVPVLIEAIKEQQKQIEELQNKLDNVLSSR